MRELRWPYGTLENSCVQKVPKFHCTHIQQDALKMALHDGHCSQPSLGALGDPIKRHSPIQARHFLNNERKLLFH